ncbi:sensor histidine kinase [Kitasatospora sp. NPDC054939]
MSEISAAPPYRRAAVAALRRELLTLRPTPLPPLTWPRSLRRLPQALVVLAAVAFCLTGADLTARILACVHAAALLVALSRPAAASWLSLALLTVIALAHPPTHDNTIWAWLVHAGVLLLLALRIPLLPAAVAAVIGAAVGAALKLAGCPVGSWRTVLAACALYVLAVVLGAVRRGRREDRARLAEQITATAQERALRTVLEERARIARELHDVVAHHLSLIAIKAEAAPYRVQDPPPALAAELTAIRAGAREGLAELRNLLGVLRPTPAGSSVLLPGQPVAPAPPQPSLARLDGLLDQVRAAGLPVTARIVGPPRPLPPGVELSAYRIVQESLSNALRHAPGAETRVELGYGREALRLRITNRPPARTAPPSPGAGHGLTGMRERAAMLGGDLIAGPAPDGGYEVAAELPAPPGGPARPGTDRGNDQPRDTDRTRHPDETRHRNEDTPV